MAETKDKSFDYLDDFSMKGFEDINSDTMSIPFLKIAQSLNPELNSRKPEYIKGLQVGQFFNSVTGAIYGEELNINIIHFEHLYTEWKPNRGGFVDRMTPEQAFDKAVDKTFGKWKTAEGNDLQENYSYFVLVEGHEQDGILVMSLASSAIKNAKKLNKLITSQMFKDGSRMAPHHQVYKVSTLFMSNDQGDWYVPNFEFIHVVGKETFLKATEERKMIPERTVDYGMLESSNSQRQISDGSSAKYDDASSEELPY